MLSAKNWQNDAAKAIAYVLHWEPREYVMGRQMEFCDEWMLALSERQAGRQRRGCPLVEGGVQIYGALLWNWQQAGWACGSGSEERPGSVKSVFAMDHPIRWGTGWNLFKQLEEIFRSQCSFLWKTSPFLISAERTTQWDESNPKRFLEHVSNSFLTEMVDEPTSGHTLLVLPLTNEKELFRGVIINRSLGCTGHEVVQDPLLLGEAGSSVQTLYFRRANQLIPGN